MTPGMPITLFQTRKRQRYLILVLIAIIPVIFLVLWYGFFIKEKAFLPESLELKRIEIGWEVLKDPRLEALQSFEEIVPFGEEVGRENPFVPY